MGAPNFTDKFNTELPPEAEQKFMAWAQKNNKLNDLFDYDLRGAYAAGLLNGDSRGHLPDTYKKPNHPTFSNESIYSSRDMPGGEWLHDDNKWVFKASPLNLQMFGAPGLEDYFKNVEPDSALLLPQVTN